MVAPLGTHTLDDITKFVYRTFGDESGVQVTSDDVVTWVNNGLNKIANDLPIFESSQTSTTIAGTSVYALPLDVMNLIGVRLDTVFLSKIEFSQAQQMKSGETAGATGAPSYYHTYGNNLHLYPTPSLAQTLIIFYEAYPTKVAVATDKLRIPDRYYELLCHYVLTRAYELDENPSMMTAKMNAYDAEYKKLSEVDKDTAGSFPVVQEYEYGVSTYAW